MLDVAGAGVADLVRQLKQLRDSAGSLPANKSMLELAEEFRQIGDTEGARDLLEEVMAKADGALRLDYVLALYAWHSRHHVRDL